MYILYMQHMLIKFPLTFGISLAKEQALCWVKIYSLGGVGFSVLALQTRSLPCFPKSVFRYTDTHRCFVSGVLSPNNVLKFENVGYL